MEFPFKLLHRLSMRSTAAGDRLSQFLSLDEFLFLAATKKIVWFGEYHSEERITPLIETLAMALGPERKKYTKDDDAILTSGSGRLHIVCEHFSFEMQDLLREYQVTESLDFDGFVSAYKNIGTEGHKLGPYQGLLEYCRDNSDAVELHAGFIPRTYAAAFMKSSTNEEKALLYKKLSEEKGFLPDLQTLQKVDEMLGLGVERLPKSIDDIDSKPVELYGSPSHFNIFESLMTGRNIYEVDEEEIPANERYSNIFQAQLMKDWAMAWKIHGIIETSAGADDRFLVLAGRAHLSHYHGVPEVLSWLQKCSSGGKFQVDRAQELLVCAQMMFEVDVDEREQKVSNDECERILLCNELLVESMRLENAKSRKFQDPVADVLYIYDEEDWGEEEEEERSSDATETDEKHDAVDSVKKETAEAYDKVGQTAAVKGNIQKAMAILTHLGYSKEDQEIIGQHDIYNYQGVGNPFILANIKSGEKVIDLGSGLGIDSFLAAHRVGNTGEVVGVDISKKEVKHARRRALERDLSSAVCFLHGDIENLPGCLNEHFKQNVDDINGYFDVAISNGAFCLAPNKGKAFENVYQVLKPGGRMAICTTTVRKDLEKETHWPLCMRMFIQLDKLKPLCEEVGFKNVMIDMEDTDLEFELEGVPDGDVHNVEDDSGRSKIHVGSEEFKHLQTYNMNELCARVVVYGEK